MDYLSILPSDLKHLLQLYINHDNWTIVAEIYKRLLTFYRPSKDESVYEKLLSKLKLKYLIKETIETDSVFSEIDFHCQTPMLDVNQLITLQTIKNILMEFAITPPFIQRYHYDINKLLIIYNCPLQIIELKITNITCFSSMIAQCERYVVINTKTHNLNDMADNIVKKLSQQ